MILRFCREFMSGEGNVMRHLSLLHYTLEFKQSYLDEFDFSVTNLAADLRDGVRLAWLLDVITASNSNSDSDSASSTASKLAAQLRVPAGSRLQKLHNVGLVLQELQRRDALGGVLVRACVAGRG